MRVRLTPVRPWPWAWAWAHVAPIMPALACSHCYFMMTDTLRFAYYMARIRILNMRFHVPRQAACVYKASVAEVCKHVALNLSTRRLACIASDNHRVLSLQQLPLPHSCASEPTSSLFSQSALEACMIRNSAVVAELSRCSPSWREAV